MLYNVLLRMIDRGATQGLAQKIDVFYAVGKLTDEQYGALCAMLPEKEEV